MAKAKPIEMLDCDGSALHGAATVLRIRFSEMYDFHAAAVSPDGVDGVHDMRVASRRLRSALRDFAPIFEKTPLKSLQKKVKTIADMLGEVRDQDVAVEALESLRERAPSDAIMTGLDLLIDARRLQRSEDQRFLNERLDADRLAALSKQINGDLTPRGKNDSDPLTFRLFGIEAIERAHKKYLERAKSIYDPFDDSALHKLRLSAKRLRYALEVFDQCWDGQLKPFAKSVSKLQSALGAVHDSSEWIASLRDTIRENGDIDRETAAWLIAEFVSLRTAEYLKALELWSEWLASDLTSQLRAIMSK